MWKAAQSDWEQVIDSVSQAHLFALKISAYLYIPLLLPSAVNLQMPASLRLAAINVQDITEPALRLTEKLVCFRSRTVPVIIISADKEKCTPTSQSAFVTCTHRGIFPSLCKCGENTSYLYLYLVVFLSLIITTSLILSWLPLYLLIWQMTPPQSRATLNKVWAMCELFCKLTNVAMLLKKRLDQMSNYFWTLANLDLKCQNYILI